MKHEVEIRQKGNLENQGGRVSNNNLNYFYKNIFDLPRNKMEKVSIACSTKPEHSISYITVAYSGLILLLEVIRIYETIKKHLRLDL